MKLPLIIAGGAVGVAALWTAGWFAGRALYVEPEADKAVAALRDGSLFFNYKQREIGGFPFSYDVAYEDVSLSNESRLWTWSAPNLRIRSGVADGGALELIPAADSKFSVEPVAFGGPEGEPPLVFDIAATALLASIGETGERADISIRADTLEATQTPGDGMVKDLRLGLAGFAFDIGAGQTGSESALRAARATFGFVFSGDMVNEVAASGEGENFAVDFARDKHDFESLAAFVASGGDLKLALEIERYRIVTKGSGGPSKPPYENRLEAASANGVFEIGDKRVLYKAAATGATYAIKEEGGIDGDVEIGLVDVTLAMPVRRGAGPFQIDVKLDAIDMEESIWKLIDPVNALKRTPVSMEIDLGGELDMLVDLGDLYEADGSAYGSPARLNSMTIKALRFEGMGLQAEASGAVDLLPGVGVMGTEVARAGLTVDVKGAVAWLDQMALAGLMSSAAVEAYAGLLTRYGRAGEEKDHYTADIRINGDETTINGLPLEQ